MKELFDPPLNFTSTELSLSIQEFKSLVLDPFTDAYVKAEYDWCALRHGLLIIDQLEKEGV